MSLTLPAVSLSLIFLSGAFCQTNVLTANYNLQRTNATDSETILTTGNVNSAGFGRVAALFVDGQIFAQPLYVSNLDVPGSGLHNVVFTATLNNSVYAFDANTLAQTPLWHVNLGPSVPTSFYGSTYTDVLPQMGILSTPVIDADTGILYVVSNTFENGAPVFRLHALWLSNGQEAQAPVVIQAQMAAQGADSVNGLVTFDPRQQLQRTGLLLWKGAVYIGFGSHADALPYHGWLIAYNASNIQQQLAVFNTSPNGWGAAMWHAGRAPAVDNDGNLYVVTGNGDYDGASSFAESFLKLSPTLELRDWFTPINWKALSDADYDLGSTGAVLIPGTDLVAGGDKFGTIYAVHAGQMGHLSPPNGPSSESFQAVRTGGVLNFAVAADPQGAILYAMEEQGCLRAFQIAAGEFNPTPVAQSSSRFDIPYQGIAVSSNSQIPGTGIVWMTTTLSHRIRPWPGVLHALDSKTLDEIWNSELQSARDSLGAFSKFAAPLVANGKVFVATSGGQLAVYGLLAGYQGPPQIGGIVSGSSFQPGPVAPGEMIAIFGDQIGPGTLTGIQFDQFGLASTTLAGSTVLFDGIPAPLLYASPTQIGAIVPWSTTGPNTNVTVVRGSQTSNTFQLPVSASLPGVFTLNATGVGQIAALNQDGTLNQPAQAALAGTIISFYVTGAGLMSPPLQNGQMLSPDSQSSPRLSVQVLIAGRAADVLYAGSAPGMLAGVIQVNARVPMETPASSAVSLAVVIGSESSQPGISIAVR